MAEVHIAAYPWHIEEYKKYIQDEHTSQVNDKQIPSEVVTILNGSKHTQHNKKALYVSKSSQVKSSNVY